MHTFHLSDDQIQIDVWLVIQKEKINELKKLINSIKKIWATKNRSPFKIEKIYLKKKKKKHKPHQHNSRQITCASTLCLLPSALHTLSWKLKSFLPISLRYMYIELKPNSMLAIPISKICYGCSNVRNELCFGCK